MASPRRPRAQAMTVLIPLVAASERYLAGESSAAIARTFGVTPATIRRKLTASGIEMRRRGGTRKLSSEQERRIVEAFLAGEKQDVLCLLYAVSRKTICRILKNSGASKVARCEQGIHVLGGLAVKRCSQCWVTRPLSQFSDDASKANGIRSNCRICEARPTS